MKRALRTASLGCCLAFTAGCVTSQPNTFTFTADLPPDFAYQAIAVYVPAKGETCTVPGGRNTEVGFNMKWRENYQPNAEIALRRTVSGCPLIISRIKLDIKSAYGKDWGDQSGDTAGIAIRDQLEDRYKGTFSEVGKSVFYGQCQWLFRTVGTNRRIVKLLDCKKTDALGEPGRGRPFSAYTLDQLPGKIVKMHIKLADEERPGWGDTWVKVPNGWKRCMGKGYEDQRAYCNGNYKDFSGFLMPDGRQCTIYPGCTE
ncbi:hypothetical protein J2X84_000510 [Pseudomonas corrugata]|uniref:hypothetical protein n=1 Tax=Pseudomonas corrugata TaxID=47879 RepID=UPI0028645A32|nr:hypothetical protein [Pseudomonas corrugata]MDR7281696.1 hypothetical protein [Pseudomonas corrugata]